MSAAGPGDCLFRVSSLTVFLWASSRRIVLEAATFPRLAILIATEPNCFGLRLPLGLGSNEGLGLAPPTQRHRHVANLEHSPSRRTDDIPANIHAFAVGRAGVYWVPVRTHEIPPNFNASAIARYIRFRADQIATNFNTTIGMLVPLPWYLWVRVRGRGRRRGRALAAKS
jgi:hypothetical protein